MRAYEYEDWPRGRIVFDRMQDRFILYADRQLMGAVARERIATQFQLPQERTIVETDFHYQSREKLSLTG